jgi:PLP dependent protein
MSSTNNYLRLLDDISDTAIACGRKPEDIKLVVVSKGQSWEQVIPIYRKGCRDFGENKLQEALPKLEVAPQDCRWHFIGTLQKNKVKKALGHFALIHSVDSLDIARKISEASHERQLKTPILMQVNTSGEISKHGMTPEECLRNFGEISSLPHLEVQGLMTMAPLVEDEALIRATFGKLRILKDRLLVEHRPLKGLPHLSMGMSHDFKLAIAEGATILRIGTRIFQP